MGGGDVVREVALAFARLACSAASRSTSSRALLRMTSSMDLMARGVKTGLVRFRKLRCSGGSISMITRIAPKPWFCARIISSSECRIMAIPLADEKTSGCFEISQMSACFVIAQKGSKSGGAQWWTGDSARSRVQTSCGTPFSAYA